MKILLDTHIAIWAVLDSEELSDVAGTMLLAQAKSEGMEFMTHDSMIPYYNEPFIISV